MLLKNWIFYLFAIYPIAILAGNFAINFIIAAISIIYISVIFVKKNEKVFIIDKQFYLLFFFFVSLIINLIFSNNILLSGPRVFKFFLIIWFILSFKFLCKNLNDNQINNLYKIWFALFCIILADLLFEYLNGKNILGYISNMPGQRLASFTGGVNIAESESVIGYFFYGFVLIFLSVFHQFFKGAKTNFLLAYLLIIVSLLIGERSNFIKVFIIINIFIFIVYEINFKSKLSFLLILISGLVIFINFNETYKIRYYNQIINIFKNNNSLHVINNSQYGAHYNVAKEIFLDNPMFGVGIKNFREESKSNKYDALDHPKNNLRVSTHPHQIHYEFLSETGIFGYLSFLIFMILSLFYSIKYYLKTQNKFQLSGILFVLSSLIPLLPSGSFLSSFNSSIFWLNYAIMMGYIPFNKKLNAKF